MYLAIINVIWAVLSSIGGDPSLGKIISDRIFNFSYSGNLYFHVTGLTLIFNIILVTSITFIIGYLIALLFIKIWKSVMKEKIK